MNNCLIIKRDDLMNKQLVVHIEVHSLNKFIENNENLFKENNSRRALKKIKSYLNNQKELQNSLFEECNNLKNEIKRTCKHEILKEEHDQLICSICDNWFWVKDVNYDHILLKGEVLDCFPEPKEVDRIIVEIAKKGEDPIESFENYVYGNHKLKNIKIYKRRMIK